MPTTTDLAVRVMKRAGILDPHENPTANESEDVVAMMEGKYAEMKELGLVDWTLTDIPTRSQEAFISVIAGHVAVEFGRLTPELADLAARGERTLYKLIERKEDGRNSPVVDY